MTETTHPYAGAVYALSLGHAGRPVPVPEWDSHVLVRPIADGGEDAMGIYPLAVLDHGSDLAGGLERLRGLGLVSVTLVPDPLAGPPQAAYAHAFGHVRLFKTHLTVDPAVGPYSPSRHHGQFIRRGHRRCIVQHGPLRPWLSDWCRLYRGLIEHRGITGVAAFPDASFEAIADLQSMVAFSATVDGRVVGMALWFAHGGVVYNHLAASDAVGYANGASYALYDSAIRHFEGQGVINLGGAAGSGAGEGGLFDFKHGFANSEVRTVLCGAILDPVRYEVLNKGRTGPFFPGYRAALPKVPLSTSSSTAAATRSISDRP